MLDPRDHGFRRDLADVTLANVLFAPHYARALARVVSAVTTPLRAVPDATSGTTSHGNRGDRFAVLDVLGDWAWGYTEHDGYVGYVLAEALAPVAAPATHVVTAVAAPVFAGADIKAPAVARWPMGVRFAAVPEGAFLLSDTGFVHARHAVSLASPATDHVTVAEALLGVPYLWGGRSGDGLDCSGLVQLALGIAGIAAPRDSDQQRARLGHGIETGEPLKRGDLIFFPGHVGIMADAETLLHANAHWMAVVAEPLADVSARAVPPIACRRLP